jgi:flagellar hook protein FlgE
MLRSMFAAVSGLRNHQTMMDVIGNNIANVNTTGFKSSSVVFEDLLSQTIKGAGGPQNGIGGSNPAQIGIGSKVGAVMTSFTQGSLQQTGKSTDLAIQGDGFFIVNQGGQQLYTRAGALSFDTNGQLVTPSGAFVQGWLADPTTGKIDLTAPINKLQMPPGEPIAPNITKTIEVGGNLPTATATQGAISTGITVYDATGNATDMTLKFSVVPGSAGPPVVAPSWQVQPFDGLTALAPAQAISIGVDGKAASNLNFNLATANGNIIPVTVDLTRSTMPLTQWGDTVSASALSQDGTPLGTLQSFNFAQDGTITGVYSNGQNKTIGQLALANFNNPMGLEKVGGSEYRATVNSGIALIGGAGTTGRGLVATGTIEMSNVDLAQEFTNLIIAQRGFQANSKVISASDEILQDLVNMKR